MQTSTLESPILQGLNPAQREAVIHYDNHSLIVAGAGSGKTRVLTSRIAYMIERGVAPWNILALTFTNKAAESMRERIGQMLPDGRSRLIRMGTFHSIFARILRENAELIGFPAEYTIYDSNDARNLIKNIVKELNLDDKKYKPTAIASRISYAKNCLVTPGAYLAKPACAAEDRQRQMPEFGNIYNIYCARCKQNGAMDFDDLLLQTNILLRDHAEVRARYQDQFRYILVDEYQDTNFAQYNIVRMLSAAGAKVCVVGDDAQSIYSFRGAKIENILSFRNDFPTAETFKLEQNYRSTRTIVEAANSVISHNEHRMEKKCFSEGDRGEPIRVLRAYTDREEAEMIVTDLRDRVREAGGEEWAEAAILYRTNNQSKPLEDALRRRGIPYRVYKGNSFYDHKEIRDMLGYIRLVVNPRDDEAFRRIINFPTRGIGDTTIDRIAALAQERGRSMWEAIDALVAEPAADAVQRAIVRKVTEFVELIRSLSASRHQLNLYDLGLEIASRSGILPLYRADQSVESKSALDNIEELLNSMQLFHEQCEAEIRAGERSEEEPATIEEWLQNVMLMTDQDNDDANDRNRVTLMTVHSAKGLEYKYVYIAGMEESLFPSQMAAESAEGFEEERRLFYVALTRAKELATLSYAETRFKWGNMEFSKPSRFLREIDARYLADDAAVGDGPCERDEEQGSALDELRRRFDYRYQQRTDSESGRARRIGGNYPHEGGRGGGYGRENSGYPQRSGSIGSFQRSGPQRPTAQPARPATPRPEVVTTPPALDRMRRVATRPAGDSLQQGPVVACGYAVGDRVEHLKFGAGVVRRIETLATDHKLVVDFPRFGEKTLLAKFAKLTKL